MSILNILGIITVVATVFVVLITVVAMATGRNETYQEPGEYRLGEPWTREPLLFSAVDEANVGPAAHHGGAHGGANDDLIGGAAHGKW